MKYICHLKFKTNKIKNKAMRTFGTYYYGKKSYKKQFIGIGNIMSESIDK